MENRTAVSNYSIRLAGVFTMISDTASPMLGTKGYNITFFMVYTKHNDYTALHGRNELICNSNFEKVSLLERAGQTTLGNEVDDKVVQSFFMS